MKHAMALDNACKNFEEDIVLYYYGENGGAERGRVEQHLASCVNCQSFVTDLNRVLPPMAEQQTRPQTFWDNYYRETVAKLREHDERKFWWRNLLPPMRTWMMPALGTAGVAVLAVALVLGKGSFMTDPAPTNIPQEILADSNQLEFFQSLEILESLNKLEEPDGNKPEAKTSELMNRRAAQAA